MQKQAALVLASSSLYRQRLLARLGLPFECLAPDVPEIQHSGELPRSMALRLARAKAAAVAGQRPGAVVIGSDQVACLDGACLAKPGGHDNARAQLLASSGRCVSFFTAVCVREPGGRELSHTEPVEVHFRKLSATEVDRYLELEQPWDCAGSFKWEALGIALFERLQGDDPTALEGLPLIALCRMLRDVGLDPLA